MRRRLRVPRPPVAKEAVTLHHCRHCILTHTHTHIEREEEEEDCSALLFFIRRRASLCVTGSFLSPKKKRSENPFTNAHSTRPVPTTPPVLLLLLLLLSKPQRSVSCCSQFWLTAICSDSECARCALPFAHPPLSGINKSKNHNPPLPLPTSCSIAPSLAACN